MSEMKISTMGKMNEAFDVGHLKGNQEPCS